MHARALPVELRVPFTVVEHNARPHLCYHPPPRLSMSLTSPLLPGGQPVEWVEKFLKMGGLTLLFDALSYKQKNL